jgi:CRP-like cAMP-binding protein
MATTQIAGHEIFQMLRPEQVSSLSAAAEEITLHSRDLVFRQGEPADYLYVVLEGQVSLRLGDPHGVSVLIDDVGPGSLFGSCVCLQISSYTLSASCSTDSKLLKINASTLKKLMDDDLMLGYSIQTMISRAYFTRYVDTMRKLQAIVQSLPLEVA